MSSKVAAIPLKLPTAELVEIQPEEARRMLERNPENNRKISDVAVARYGRLMAAGMWQVNGETIKIRKDGWILDGQHRLWACFNSGASFKTWIIRGLDADVFGTIDTGRPRSAGDVLTIAGEEFGRDLASVIQWKWRYDRGAIKAGNIYAAPHELRAVLAKFPGLRDGMKTAGELSRLLPRSITGWLHYEFHERDAAMAGGLFEFLRTGVGAVETDPAYRLRETLLRQDRSKRRSSVDARAAMVIKTWNAMRAGRSIGLLSWKAATEEFPVIQ